MNHCWLLKAPKALNYNFLSAVLRTHEASLFPHLICETCWPNVTAKPTQPSGHYNSFINKCFGFFRRCGLYEEVTRTQDITLPDLSSAPWEILMTKSRMKQLNCTPWAVVDCLFPFSIDSDSSSVWSSSPSAATSPSQSAFLSHEIIPSCLGPYWHSF